MILSYTNSFSQKRLVSFLLSVYHRPRLLVLDEPTVGLDFFKQHKLVYILRKTNLNAT
jgi:ABC-2 type transport system ATP-binding protein